MNSIKSLDKVAPKGYILTMKKVLLTIIPIFLFAIAVYATTYDYFQGHSEGDNIRLEWKTNDESSLKKIVIERKTPQSSYIEIATIEPKRKNNSFYSYLDESAYKTQDLAFKYRLKFVDNNSVSYSSEATVASNVSNVKRTWGSIKAMFR